MCARDSPFRVLFWYRIPVMSLRLLRHLAGAHDNNCAHPTAGATPRTTLGKVFMSSSGHHPSRIAASGVRKMKMQTAAPDTFCNSPPRPPPGSAQNYHDENGHTSPDVQFQGARRVLYGRHMRKRSHALISQVARCVQLFYFGLRVDFAPPRQPLVGGGAFAGSVASTIMTCNFARSSTIWILYSEIIYGLDE